LGIEDPQNKRGEKEIKVEVPPQPFSALTVLMKSTLDIFLRRGSYT
jgi:hypothetical protein